MVTMRDATSPPELPGFRAEPFEHEGTTKLVYRAGAGPGVVVCHELPGITPQVLAFARRVVDAGFTVALPWFVGDPGRALSVGYNLREMAKVCVSREIHVLVAHRSSPITDWLRAVCRDLHARAGGPGVGVIGMCVTGNFALATMLEPSVLAPVLCQPSLPLPLGRRASAALHASPDELACARARLADGSAGLLALRFTGDRLVPDARFDTLRRELPGAELIEIDSRPGNPHGIGRFAHSVVTNHLVDREGHPTRAALDRVLSFFAERLR